MTRIALFLPAILVLGLAAAASAQEGGGVVVVGPMPGDTGGPIRVRSFDGGAVVSTRVVRPTPFAPSDDAVQAMLRERRRLNLERFRAYVDGELYPRNRTAPGFASVLIDEDDRFCAVANLMRQDGLEPLLRQTSLAQNDIRLAPIESGPLHDWILTSGFTREEIDRIQAPFFGVPITDDGEQRRLEQREKRRLKRLYQRIVSELERNTAPSLRTATARLLAARSAVGPVTSPVVLLPPVRPGPLALWAPPR